MKKLSFCAVAALLILLASCAVTSVETPAKEIVVPQIPQVQEVQEAVSQYSETLVVPASQESLEALKTSFAPLFEGVEISVEKDGIISFSSADSQKIENIKALLSCGLTSLSMAEDGSLVYSLDTEAGTISFIFSDEGLSVSAPDSFTDAMISEIKESLFSGVESIPSSKDFAEVLALLSSVDGKAKEIAASIRLPEVEEVSVPVISETVSKTIQNKEESAVQKAESQAAPAASRFNINPLVVILSVVGGCVVLGFLYYLTVHRPKMKKKKKK